MSGPETAGKELANRLGRLEDEHATGVIQTPMQDVYVAPARYYEKDPRDDYYEAKSRVTEDAKSAVSKFGTQVLVTDADIKYLQDQRTKEELYTFDKWFYQVFKPGADPNKLKLAKEIYPDWFARREQEIDRQIDIATKLALMGLRGPRNQTELELMYAIDSGRVEPPNLDMLFPEKVAAMGQNQRTALERKAITSGYWNPRKFTVSRNIARRNLAADKQPFIAGDYEGRPVELQRSFLNTRALYAAQKAAM